MSVNYKEAPEDIEGKLEALEHCLVYLKTFDNPSKLISNEKTYKTLYLIRNILSDSIFAQKPSNYLKFNEHKIFNLFGNLLLYLSTLCEEIEFVGNEPDVEDLHELHSDNQKRIYILEYLCSILFSLTDSSEFGYFNRAAFEFSVSLALNNGLRGLITFFTHELFLQSESDYVQILIGRLLSRIKNLSEKEFDNDAALFHKLKVVPVLKRFKTLNTCKNHPEYFYLVDEIVYYLNQKPLQQNIQNLCDSKQAETLIESESAFASLHYIYNALKFHKTNKYKLFTLFNCEQLFIDLLNYFADEVEEGGVKKLDFKSDLIRQDLIPGEFNNSNECKITWLSYLNTCINCLFENSLEFTLNFAKLNGFVPYLKFLKNTRLTTNITLNNLEGFLYHLAVLSKYSATNREQWRKLEAINTLLDIARLFCMQPEIVDSVYMIIADIANDTEIDELEEIHFVLDSFVKRLKEFDECFVEKKDLSIEYGQYLNDENKIEEFKFNIIRPNPLTFILRGLNLLAINERVKLRLFNHYLIFESLKRILYYGFTLEKIGSIKLISRICFNADLCQKISQDREFVSLIKYLSNSLNVHKDLRKASKELVWLMSERFQRPPLTLQHEVSSQKRVKFYVTISHDNGRGKEMAERLKSELALTGYDVFMYEGVNYRLDAMWKSIEDSYCVIWLLSESYRQSVTCQAEAQYSVRLKKPTVPVIIEESLDIENGWIAKLIATKKLIYLKDEIFDDCVKLIETEIRRVNIAILENFKLFETKKDEMSQILEWSRDEIHDWFVENELNETIFECLLIENGKELKELYDLKMEAPEFFYQTLARKTNQEPLHLTKFAKSLEFLFSLNKKN